MSLLDRLERDLILMPARLLGKEEELYDTYDRLRAEAEFRAAVALPLIALAGPFYFRIHFSLVFILPLASGMLLYSALRRIDDAYCTLAEALRAEREDLTTPVLHGRNDHAGDGLASNSRNIAEG
ncbi:hypothetical protein [Nonomuraea maheshkhaliensis]|uniref:hypothetical protein n=1 Tax=Nonomuraea maheshkhaliensis TaxID=419590 RepID=UPI0031F769B8